ncbi:MAG: MBL fold metallo-hydrolase [Clostridiales Family XIII bacterium]|jgi:glyoxylase-like metal-dependent hydrolase (beta-lactamase superfamily II)|nr:MBL fold metallo-hydrolase [Clostridiales Family XIII bacterium]
MHEFDFLSHEQLGERLYVVRESLSDKNFNIFVIIGDQKVMVIDSGMGFSGGLRRYIERYITDKKPMLSYATHGDLDHIGSAILFDEAYLNHRDLEKLDWNLNVERRLSDLNLFCGGDAETMAFAKANYVRNENVQFKDVDDGDVVDLGGVQFEVIMTPGHTAGSVAYLNRKDGYVILGDAAIKGGSWQRCKDYDECLECQKRFVGLLPDDVAIYNNHDLVPVPRQMLDDITTALEEILAGKSEGDTQFTLMFDFIDPEELTYDVWEHTVGMASVPYNANILKERGK